MLIAETLLILAVALCKSSVFAYPSFAGSCNAGNKALAGSDHLLGGNTIKTGSLATGSYAVTLGGSVLTPNVVSTFPTNTNTNLVITGTKAFKGFLVRLGKVGEVNSLTPVGTNMQVSSICTSSNVGGVSHTNANSKTSITTTLKVTGVASSMPLDITIVVQNSNGLSEYYYSQFLLSSTAVTKVPTNAPVTTKVPTNAPVVTKVPTNAPVTTKVPTNAPVTTKVPTKAPVTTKVPTNAPVTTKVPTKAPVTTKVPTNAPVTTKVPTNAPVTTKVPTKAPVTTKVPTNAPVTTKVPTNAPVTTKVPTNAPVTTKVPTNAPVITKVPTNAPVTTKVPTNAPVITKVPTKATVTTKVPTNAPVPTGGIVTTPSKEPNDSSSDDEPDDDETPQPSGPN